MGWEREGGLVASAANGERRIVIVDHNGVSRTVDDHITIHSIAVGHVESDAKWTVKPTQNHSVCEGECPLKCSCARGRIKCEAIESTEWVVKEEDFASNGARYVHLNETARSVIDAVVGHEEGESPIFFFVEDDDRLIGEFESGVGGPRCVVSIIIEVLGGFLSLNRRDGFSINRRTSIIWIAVVVDTVSTDLLCSVEDRGVFRSAISVIPVSVVVVVIVACIPLGVSVEVALVWVGQGRTIVRDIQDSVVVIIGIAHVPLLISIEIGLLGIGGRWTVVGGVGRTVVVVILVAGISLLIPVEIGLVWVGN